MINDEPSEVFNNKEKAIEMFNKYSKYFNKKRFKLDISSGEIDNENECFSLSYCGRLIGFFSTESEAWKENSKYHKVQFDTNVASHKILSDLSDYWKGVFDKEIKSETEFNRKLNEAWQELIRPIKHTII
jgi:hypothetical protein